MKERLNIELSYLKKLVAGLKTLGESQFEYRHSASQYDKENQCGTVCCAWGWMAIFVTESGVKWLGIGCINTPPEDFFSAIKRSDVGFVFYGFDVEDHDSDKFGDDYHINLQQVINRIEHVISSYEKNN